MGPIPTFGSNKNFSLQHGEFLFTEVHRLSPTEGVGEIGVAPRIGKQASANGGNAGNRLVLVRP